MRPDPMELYPSGGMENCQLCDDSFGWPLQEPGLESELRDAGVPVFDLDSDNWNKQWQTRPDQAAESAWQQLGFSVAKAAPRETSLTPMLAALDIPRTLLSDIAPLAAAAYHKQAMERRQQAEGAAGTLPPSSIAWTDLFHRHQPQEDAYPAASKATTAAAAAAFAVPPILAALPPSAGLAPQARMLLDPENLVTIGTYTRAERAAKLDRFRRKRERRNFAKRVLYGCRKQFADSRPRIGGRFVVNVNRVVKPKTFLKRGRPRKVPLPSDLPHQLLLAQKEEVQ